MNVGDIVKLNSGGPSMTIKQITQDYRTEFEEIYRCTWFEDKKLQSENFNSKVLTKIK
jgi:uncharacterized protein YodC (DUF2158 family)